MGKIEVEAVPPAEMGNAVCRSGFSRDRYGGGVTGRIADESAPTVGIGYAV